MNALYASLVKIPFFLFCLLAAALVISAPVHAFTADSLSILVAKNGNATATFRYTLEGVIENAIPESVLQDQLVNGLATSSDPPQVVSFDKSQATLILKNFAMTTDVPAGTEYQTSPMDFKNAQIALRNSAVSTVISADFSPKTISVTFPDGYTQELSDSSVLPGLKHTVIDPAKAASATASGTTAQGSLKVSAIPGKVRVYIDSSYAGETPDTFRNLSPGRHDVMLEADGYVSRTVTATISAGNTTTLFVTLDRVLPTTEKAGLPVTSTIVTVIVSLGGAAIFLCRK